MAFHAITRPEILNIAGSDISDTAFGKMRRRTQVIAKPYVFYANTKTEQHGEKYVQKSQGRYQIKCVKIKFYKGAHFLLF